jgi:hypothetical protein
MHEFELGVWKNVFTHLIRMLYVFGLDKVSQLNRRWVNLRLLDHHDVLMIVRYRKIPRFGCLTIRRFSNDVSAMKKLAARDFEDLLQVGLLSASTMRPILIN